MNDESVWKTDDEEWMAQRKSEWRKVVANLNIISNIVSKKAQKYHKELFFTGQLHPDLTSQDIDTRVRVSSLRVFSSNKLFFDMWYHPEPSEAIFKDMISKEETSEQVRCLREILFVRTKASAFNSSYGMAGGREELMVRACLQSVDWKEEVYFGSDKLDDSISASLHPDRILNSTPRVTYVLLNNKYKINPFAPYQYLWDHLDFALEHYSDEFENPEDYGYRDLSCALRTILDFYDRDGDHKEREHAINLRNELYNKFERREFLPKLMGFWDKEKSSYEAGDPAPTL